MPDCPAFGQTGNGVNNHAEAGTGLSMPPASESIPPASESIPMPSYGIEKVNF
jgi:hypothetical protein